MAQFNPSVPQAPDYPYINYGREISEPKPDTSKEIALKGAASALTTGVEAIDTSIKMGASKEIYSQVDPVQEERVQSLQNQYQTLLGGDPTQTHPQDLKNLPGQIDKLHSARDAGKLTQIDTDARLNSIAKTIRAKYPGYREYVDEIFEKATGRTPANKLAAALSQGINELESESKAGKDRVLNAAYGALHTIPGMNQMIEDYQAQRIPGSAVLKRINDFESSEHALTIANKLSEENEKQGKWDKEADMAKAKLDAADYNSTQIHSTLNHFFDKAGWGDKDKLQAAFNDYRSGKMPSATSEQLQRMGVFGQMSRQALKAELMYAMTKSSGKDGKSTQDRLGSTEEAEKQVEADLKLHYDSVMDPLVKGEFALANYNKIILNGREMDTLGTVMDDPTLQKGLIAGNVVHKNFPEYSSGFSALMFKIPTGLAQAKFAVDAAVAAAPPPPEGKKSLKETFQEAQVKNIKDRGYNKSLVDLVSIIGDKNVEPEAKDALIDYAFSDKNKDFLPMFDQDHGITKRGGPTRRGQQYIFSGFTSDANIREIEKRGKEHPELWANFRNWAENDVRYTFDQDVIRERGEVAVNRYTGASLTYNTNTGGFTAKTKEPSHGESIHGVAASVQQTKDLNARLVNINNNLGSMQKIYSHDKGVDPQAKMYTLLKSLNAEPGSVVDKMLKAMEVAHGSGK